MFKPLSHQPVLAGLVMLLTSVSGCVFGQTTPAPAPTPARSVPPTGAAPQPTKKNWPYPDKLAMMQRNVLRSIPQGRLDHMAMDVASNTLYVAAPGNASLEVHMVAGSEPRQVIDGLIEPSGVAICADSRLLIVSCADFRCLVYPVESSGKLTIDAARSVDFGKSCDSLRYDPVTRRAWVSLGDSIASFDPVTGEKGPEVELGTRAEAFVFENDPSADTPGRMFVNLPKEGAVAVIRRASEGGGGSIVAKWPLGANGAAGPKDNYPIAIDPASKRLFVACREPSVVVVLDSADGRIVASVPCAQEADDIWYDGVTRRILVSAGIGSVTGIAQTTADAYEVEFTQKTMPGARTSLFVPEIRRFIVAAPKFIDENSYLYIYAIGPAKGE